MSDDFWGGMIIAAMIAGGIYFFTKDNVAPQVEVAVGRYQIITSKDTPPFLIDTTNGDSWRWVRIESKYSKNKYGVPDVVAFMWEKQERYDNATDEARYIINIRQFDKDTHGPKTK